MSLKQILISILLIFVIGIVQTALAQNSISGTVVTHDFSPNGNLNSQTTCTSLVDGIWNENTKTCTIPDNGRVLKIGDRQTLVIDAGYTLVVSNTGISSNGIFLPTSISGGGKIINNGVLIISNSGAYSHGIQVSKPSSITNNGIILIINSGRGSNGIFTADYIGCSYAIHAYTGGCATSLTNNGDIIIANTNPPSSSKWDQSNGIYGGKIIDKGIIRVMNKADAYKELDKKKSSEVKTLDDKKSSDAKKAIDAKKAEKIKLAKERYAAKKASKRCADFSQKDLSGCDLRGMTMHDKDLSQVSLIGADLTGVDLARTNLTGANLDGAYFGRAILTGTIFTGCIGIPTGQPAVGTLPICAKIN